MQEAREVFVWTIGYFICTIGSEGRERTAVSHCLLPDQKLEILYFFRILHKPLYKFPHLFFLKSLAGIDQPGISRQRRPVPVVQQTAVLRMVCHIIRNKENTVAKAF